MFLTSTTESNYGDKEDTTLFGFKREFHTLKLYKTFTLVDTLKQQKKHKVRKHYSKAF